MIIKTEKAFLKYSYSEDIIFIKPIKRSYDHSIQIGDLILDLNEKNKIVGFEIMNASKIFGVKKQFMHALKEFVIKLTITKDFIKFEAKALALYRNAVREHTIDLERINDGIEFEDELKISVKN